MDIKLLVKLTSKAWSLKILALLHTGIPGRQAPLMAATRASRSSFAASLEHLVHLGLLERNPGHGHPLRPEFRLTPLGVTVAAMAHRILDATPDETTLSCSNTTTIPLQCTATQLLYAPHSRGHDTRWKCA